jgi:hypothetical protein
VKSRQPLDLPKKQGGYGRVRSSSSRSRESLDRWSVTRQPSDLTGAARGLPSGFEGSVVPWSNVFRHLKPRSPGKIWTVRQLDTWWRSRRQEFGKSEVPWIGDRGSP